MSLVPRTGRDEVVNVAIGETFVHVNGRIVTDLELRHIEGVGEMVGFMVISNERKFDKKSGEWVDGHRFSVWVTCWRRLARNVAMTLKRNDDVMAFGKLRTREYEDGGKTRYAIEMEAFACGPNLTRAIADVRRIRAGEPAEVAPAAA